VREAALRSRSVRPPVPATAEEILGKALRLLAVLTAVSAVTSVTIFHPDEHFQTVEFASLKLGFTAASELPWEYAARLRPWLQPALYTLIAKGALALGGTSRFVLLGLFRAATALFSFVAFRSCSSSNALRARWLAVKL
jgi:phosphatidylinositol glycan class B